jgi:hypothetical protein
MTSRLWIFGDSYGQSLVDHNRLWTNQLSKKLNYELKNMSLVGCSQDYICQMVADHLHHIKSEDQLIIVLTSSIRFWFFEDYPMLTHPYLGNLQEKVGKDRKETVELYFKHVQRNRLDSLHCAMRLTFLSHLAVIARWKQPLIVFAYNEEVNCQSILPNLIFSNGNLTDNVSQAECATTTQYGVFQGVDPRYNHMCLRNHDVLSEKIYNTVMNNHPLDLTTGFHLGILNPHNIYDQEIVNEFDPKEYDKLVNHLSKKNKVSTLKKHVFRGKTKV